MHIVRSLKITLVLALTGSLIEPFPAGAAPPEGTGKPHQEHRQEKAQKSENAKQGAHTPGPKPGAEAKTTLISASIGLDKARQIAVSNHYTGYGALPPGVRKNLARGKPLPPGIAKKLVPGPMLAQLPTYPGQTGSFPNMGLRSVAVLRIAKRDIPVKPFTWRVERLQ